MLVHRMNDDGAYLVVDKSPLFEERMHAHDGANVSRQVSSAGGDSEVLRRPQPVRVDHEVAVVLVNRRCLAPVPRVEELWHGAPFYGVDFGHVEPRRVRRDNDLVRLGSEVLSRLLF